MDWFNLLKEPKLRTGSKITTTLGSDSKEDEEGPCFKKLKEYQEKIAGKTYIMDKNIKMHVKHKLKYMPEEVACAALKLLNETKLSKNYIPDSINFVTLNVDGTEYHVESYWFYDFSKPNFRVTMELEVYMPEVFGVNLYFRVSVRTITLDEDNLSLDKMKKYSEMVNWRDN
tara:strand:+ start:591 stop:1106 length:516 start_codon:yes stop_codon:yes gene_type:complete